MIWNFAGYMAPRNGRESGEFEVYRLQSKELAPGL
jgi:hypothetical protein